MARRGDLVRTGFDCLGQPPVDHLRAEGLDKEFVESASLGALRIVRGPTRFMRGAAETSHGTPRRRGRGVVGGASREEAGAFLGALAAGVPGNGT